MGLGAGVILTGQIAGEIRLLTQPVTIPGRHGVTGSHLGTGGKGRISPLTGPASGMICDVRPWRARRPGRKAASGAASRALGSAELRPSAERK